MKWPLDQKYSKINSTFHVDRKDHLHEGVDISTPHAGTELYAPESGNIIYSDYNGTKAGSLIILKANSGNQHHFAHLSQRCVSSGTKVNEGDLIGMTGGVPGKVNSGNSKGAHLHWAIQVGGTTVDPLHFFNQAALQEIKKSTEKPIVESSHVNTQTTESILQEITQYDDTKTFIENISMNVNLQKAMNELHAATTKDITVIGLSNKINASSKLYKLSKDYRTGNRVYKYIRRKVM